MDFNLANLSEARNLKIPKPKMQTAGCFQLMDSLLLHDCRDYQNLSFVES